MQSLRSGRQTFSDLSFVILDAVYLQKLNELIPKRNFSHIQHCPTSDGRSAGFTRFLAFVPGVPLRSTPGFMLLAASRAFDIF